MALTVPWLPQFQWLSPPLRFNNLLLWELLHFWYPQTNTPGWPQLLSYRLSKSLLPSKSALWPETPCLSSQLVGLRLASLPPPQSGYTMVNHYSFWLHPQSPRAPFFLLFFVDTIPHSWIKWIARFPWSCSQVAEHGGWILYHCMNLSPIKSWF